MLVSIADLQRGQAALQPYLEQAVNLSTMYDRYLDEDEGDGHERKPGIHASELGCKRRAYYTLIGAPRNNRVPRKWKKRFEHGKAIHHMLQRQFHNMARRSNGFVTFEDEVKVSAEYQAIAAELELDSSCDGVFTFFRQPFEDPFLRIGLEIKSESPDSYVDVKKPKVDHVQQGHLYMKALDLPLMWFFYFNKGDQANTTSYHPWLVPFDEARWREVENTCRELLQARDEKKPPEGNESIWCEFCPYRDRSLCNPKYLSKRAARVAPGRLRT